MPLPSQSYLKKKGFRMFLRRAIDFSDTFSKEYSLRKRERERERKEERERK